MSPQELSAKARKMVSEGAMLLDVRSPEEFSRGHVEGARNIPIQELERRLKELGAPGPVVVYCLSGIRSASAEQLLRKHGFQDVLNLQTLQNW